MVQREREMEGEDFKDKDAFVTPGYLLQQEELRKNEEEEKKRDGQSLRSSLWNGELMCVGVWT